MKNMKKHIVRCILIPLFLISDNEKTWNIIKFIMKKMNIKIRSFFIYYSPNQKSTNMFFYEWFHMNHKRKWKMMFCGFHKQSAGWGMNFFLNIDEKDLTNPKNELKLREFIDRINKIKNELNIDYINYAGIFPSVLKRQGYKLYNSSTEKTVAKIVVDGIHQACTEENLNLKECSFFILGGKGLVGAEVSRILTTQGIKYNIVEKNDRDFFNSKIIENNKKKIVIINISRQGVLEQYDDLLNENHLVINEVFPPPRLNKMNNIKYLYHIKGFEAKSYPNLLSAYKGAYNKCMPCCALIFENNDKYSHPKVILAKMKK